MERTVCNVGDVIAIYRYGDHESGEPSGIGVVVKIYDENRCFVRLLRNFSIPRYACKPWKKVGIEVNEGYYVRREDQSRYLFSTAKFTYQTSPTRAYATKTVTRSCTPLHLQNEARANGYLKTIPGQKTEVYIFDTFSDIIPKFLMMKDCDSGIIAVVFQNFADETVNHMATRAHAKIQIRKLEKLAYE